MSKKRIVIIAVCVAVVIVAVLANFLLVPHLLKRNGADSKRELETSDVIADESTDEGNFDTVETITGQKVIVTDHGVVANDPASAENNLKALNKIINSCSDGTAAVCWDLSLADLKQLALNAVMYSGLDEKRKRESLSAFGEAWKNFVNECFEQYGL